LPDFEVTSWDILILVGYVIGSRIFFGWYLSRQVRSGDADSYFLAGRNIAWPIIGLSFYVSNMSGSTFVALPASGYDSGVAVYHYEWLPALILIFFVMFLLPSFLRARVSTAPQFLQARFNAKSKIVFSGFLIFANIFIDASAALYAGATVLEVLFPDVSFNLIVIAACLIAGLYIFVGGLGAVVLNDTLQATLILIGGSILAWITWQEIPGWEAVQQAAPEGNLSLYRPADDPLMPWPGIFTGVLIVGLYFWCMNQFIIQRALGARSLNDARWGSLFAGLLKLPNLFILILPGVMAITLYPELESPDQVFPTLVFDLLPVGFRGLMLAALAAAILSSLEAIFNSASTLFTLDIVKSFRPRLSDKATVRTGQLATLAFMVLAASWAPVIRTFPNLWQYLQSILSYVTPPVVVVFLFGIFWQRATSTAATVTLATGILVGVGGWLANEIFELVQIQYLYASGIMFMASLLLMWSVSLLSAPPDQAAIRNLLWSGKMWKSETEELRSLPWYKNYRYLSVGLTLLSLFIVGFWW